MSPALKHSLQLFCGLHSNILHKIEKEEIIVGPTSELPGSQLQLWQQQGSPAAAADILALTVWADALSQKQTCVWGFF